MNLTALQHSPFLQSLGWAIANSLWQAAALWICYYLIVGTYKNAAAKFKTNAANILLSLSFIWFCYTLFDKYFSLLNKLNDVVTQADPSSYITTNSFAGTQWQLILNKAAAALPYLSVAYLLLLVFLSIKLINSFRYINFVKLHGLQKPDAEWKLFTERVARHIGISKKIKLWVSHHIDVPATIGFFKPVILIPIASINQLSPNQLEAIILHELSHIKRNDYLINIFISLVETILFFNPFIVLLAKIIKRERENCCDDFVIQYQYDRHSYASALLSLEQYRNINLRLAITATSGKKQLLLRVKRIMEVKNNAGFNYGQKLLALLLITGVFCSIAWLSPSSTEKTHVPAKTINTSSSKIKKYKASSENNTIKIISPSIPLAKVEKTQFAQRLNTKAPVNYLRNNSFDEENSQQTADQNNFENITVAAPEIETPVEKVWNNTQPSIIKKHSSVNFDTKQLAPVAWQKFVALLQNKKYFSAETFQNEIKKAMADVQKNVSAANVFKNFKSQEIEEMINAEMNTAAKSFVSASAKSLRIFKTPNNTTCVSDSISRKMFFLNRRISTASATSLNISPSVERRIKRRTPPAPPEFAFNYTSPTEVYKPASPEVTGLKKLNLDKDTHIEYSNGVLTINGKTVRVNGFSNDHDKNVAQVKGKKLSIVSGENVIEINLND